jgi:hypothetical protein
MHGIPAQQSAVVVQLPPVGIHCVPPQTRGGLPLGFGTHGKLQQSALVEQPLPT